MNSDQPTYEELRRQALAAAEPRSIGADTAIACDRLVRIFSSDGIEVQALQGLELTVAQGDLVALVGASGSGKSTLLNILAGLDVPTAGTATVGGYNLLEMSAKDTLRYRREAVGFVWQQTARNLLPFLTAAQNIAVPLQLKSGAGRGAAKRHAARVADLLEALGIGHLADRRPAQLSGGEQQRVAVAVAMANNPPVLLADEPTGELDSETGAAIFEAFRTVNRELGATVVIVTHDPLVAGEVRRTVAIRDGRTSSEVLRRTVTDEHGAESVSEREYVMLDRTGRVQLPYKFLEALGMEHRVAVDLAPDHIEIRPDSAEDPA
ncbi:MULTISPECIES: ABC transporter ATP-binding protein [unclassified Streptomyces]|uniref:ABC transporter ATP-binding protein n=1 Tax=unclassified Streptomyces TaxID=2593676 RepID=UPI0022519C5B|nr:MULTISPECIES: ABC transporter ATP-binding protein [unclassified Streptomyces]MCX4631617.1 ABC transporter ATP-binding protein [Streptomyces sp. NBC_01443]WSW47463.1 ABC transporter ATP-binding protein [Streptomyces sp. NBC_01001]